MNQSNQSEYVLVLWGAGYEETMAAGFIAAFRQQGMAVTVVGISGRHNSGAHGLTLQPDLPLGDALALADRATFVVIPSTTNALVRMNADPRLTDLIRRAQDNDAHFLLSDPATAAELELDPIQSHIIPHDVINAEFGQIIFKLMES